MIQDIIFQNTRHLSRAGSHEGTLFARGLCVLSCSIIYLSTKDVNTVRVRVR